MCIHKLPAASLLHAKRRIWSTYLMKNAHHNSLKKKTILTALTRLANKSLQRHDNPNTQACN